MTSNLVDTLARLPASPGITYRGISGPSPQTTTTSENFTAERLAAIVTAGSSHRCRAIQMSRKLPPFRVRYFCPLVP